MSINFVNKKKNLLLNKVFGFNMLQEELKCLI